MYSTIGWTGYWYHDLVARVWSFMALFIAKVWWFYWNLYWFYWNWWLILLSGCRSLIIYDIIYCNSFFLVILLDDFSGDFIWWFYEMIFSCDFIWRFAQVFSSLCPALFPNSTGRWIVLHFFSKSRIYVFYPTSLDKSVFWILWYSRYWSVLYDNYAHGNIRLAGPWLGWSVLLLQLFSPSTHHRLS